MYDLVDRPVSILPKGSRFLLWAMRGWVTARGHNMCPPAHLTVAFLKMQAIEALPHFHICMSALNCDGREVMNFHCIHRPQISDSEAVLLRLWSSMAAGEERTALRVIELMVQPEAVSPVFSAIHAALPGLRMAGLDPVIPQTQVIKGNVR